MCGVPVAAVKDSNCFIVAVGREGTIEANEADFIIDLEVVSLSSRII
jgi:hypothetical protein